MIVIVSNMVNMIMIIGDMVKVMKLISFEFIG